MCGDGSAGCSMMGSAVLFGGGPGVGPGGPVEPSDLVPFQKVSWVPDLVMVQWLRWSSWWWQVQSRTPWSRSVGPPW